MPEADVPWVEETSEEALTDLDPVPTSTADTIIAARKKEMVRAAGRLSKSNMHRLLLVASGI